jgi:hypothetical protein
MIVSATYNPSPLVLQPRINELPVFVNYYANSAFTWSEILSNSSLGLPPTGGVFVDIVSGTYILAELPYVNLTNRHFPTIATVPHVENLYSTEDSGGYFIPRMLGTTTFLSKNNTNVLDTSLMMTSLDRGTSAIYQNIDIYNNDYGLSQTSLVEPVSNVDSDAIWMKSSVTEWKNAGMIINPASYQQFVPYQTKYENTKTNNIGIHQQKDKYDPWTGVTDSTWENTTDFPPNYTKEYNIDGWYSQFAGYKAVWQWKTDIFDNQYALLKDLSGINTMYDKKQALGELWVRNNRNMVLPASALLQDFYTNYRVTSNPILSSEIYTPKDIDLWYDTLMLKTPTYLVFNKINFDYNTNVIDFDINNLHLINLSASGHEDKFAGTWFFDREKLVTVATLVSSVSGIYPALRSYDIDSNVMKYIYNTQSVDTNQLSALQLNSIEEPVFTYNKDTKTYVMTFIGKSNIYTSFVLINLYIKNNGEDYEVSKVSVITPTI